MNKLLSFIIPCFNSEDTIALCLNSIMNQDRFSDDIEIILIDDGSNDSTKRIIEENFKIDNLKIINNKHNRGIAFSRNNGIKLSKGKILAFLDSDMIVNKSWIRAHVEILIDKNVVGVVGNNVLPKGKNPNRLDKYLYDKRRGARQFNEQVPIKFPYFFISFTT